MLKMLRFGWLAMLASPAFAQASSPMPHVAVGDTFVYAGKYTTVDCSRWTVTAVGQNGYNVSTCGGDKAYTDAGTDALVRIVGPSGTPLVAFKPASPGLQFPLEVNKTWQADYGGYTADNGVMFISHESCKVSGQEAVATKMGNLPSYRIDCDDHWTVGAASGNAHQSSWYSPQAGVVVKVRNAQEPKWNFDLVSYKHA